MTRSLLDYHFLEDGELNRLWYEENDERARDAFQIRWWIGTESKSADVVAGKDLLANYHTLFLRRCLEQGIYAEDHVTEVFRAAAKLLVAEFPADPIEKFEDLWLTFVDRGIAAAKQKFAPPASGSPAEQKAKLEKALADAGAEGQRVRDWLASGNKNQGEPEFAKLLTTMQNILRALDGAAAENHPLIRTAEPEPSKLDPSVAVPHFHAKPLFDYAFQGGSLSKRENEHIDWCQPCRERCLGALLALRRLRQLLGGELPALPAVSPHFDQLLQAEAIGIPVIDTSKAKTNETKAGGKGAMVVVVLIVAAVAIAIAISS
jgi:hypothetical protein